MSLALEALRLDCCIYPDAAAFDSKNLAKRDLAVVFSYASVLTCLYFPLILTNISKPAGLRFREGLLPGFNISVIEVVDFPPCEYVVLLVDDLLEYDLVLLEPDSKLLADL